MVNEVILFLKNYRNRYLKWKKEYEIKREFRNRYRNSVQELKRLARNNPNFRNYLIGPTNAAGQGYLWVQNLRKYGESGDALRIVSDLAEVFDADLKIPRQDFIKWQDRFTFAKSVFAKYNIVLMESLRPLFGLKNDSRNLSVQNSIEDLYLLRKMKIRAAVVFHGSDIRDTDFHKEMCEFSPFHYAPLELKGVSEKAATNRSALPKLLEMKLPIFVTTPDLFHEVPTAKWLPVCVDFEKFNLIAKQSPAFNHGGPVRVLYLPSKSWIKSKSIIEPILKKLNDEGVIQWIARESVPHTEVSKLISEVDVVVDQFLGIVGVLPCEAMAAGRMVLTHLSAWANQNLPELPPVIDVTPDNLESVLRSLKPSPERIAAGIAYVKRWHDGRESALRLQDAFKR